MTRRILTALLGLALTGAAANAQAADTCLRPGRIDQITMKGANAAIVRDKDGGVFRIDFSAPCGARHVGAFFVLHLERMQTCVAHGAYLDTNHEGACYVSSVRAAS